MINKNHTPIGKKLSWNTKLFVLLAMVLVIFSFTSDNTQLGITIGSVVALLVVLVVDYFQIISRNHPKTWRNVKFILIALVILLTFIGFFPNKPI